MGKGEGKERISRKYAEPLVFIDAIIYYLFCCFSVCLGWMHTAAAEAIIPPV
jgi:hypothetical protein